jgi:methionine aminopeptidase
MAGKIPREFIDSLIARADLVDLIDARVLAIEPMVNAGTAAVELLDDGWTVVTADRRLSAHFEHTVAIRERGPEVLTLAARA